MAGYGVLAVLLMGWVLSKFPLPSIDVDSPLVVVLALTAVPLSLWLTAVATRLLPSPRTRTSRPMVLSL